MKYYNLNFRFKILYTRHYISWIKCTYHHMKIRIQYEMQELKQCIYSNQLSLCSLTLKEYKTELLPVVRYGSLNVEIFFAQKMLGLDYRPRCFIYSYRNNVRC